MISCFRHVVTLLITALFTAAAGAEPEPPQAKFSAEVLPSLVRQYRAMGLPEPPLDARLLLLPYREHRMTGITSDEHVLGFRLKAGDGGKDLGTFLVGPEIWKPVTEHTRGYELVDFGTKPYAVEMYGPPLAVNPAKLLAAELHRGEGYLNGGFSTDVWLSAAIQCQMRGYPMMAKQILVLGLIRAESSFVEWHAASNDKCAVDAGYFFSREITAGHPDKALAAVAWNHWLDVAVATGTDRHKAYGHMAELLATYADLKGERRERLVESLRLAIVPSTAEPGSPEAIIDALVDAPDSRNNRFLLIDELQDPLLNQLIGLGFAAMPALMDHLEDKRLLRGLYLVPQEGMFPRELGPVITSLVEGAASGELPVLRTREEILKYDGVKAIRAWWERASKSSEKDYVCSHVFSADKEANEPGAINRYWLSVATRRYPRELGNIYERLLRERPDLFDALISEAIVACEGLPREEKIRLLELGAIHPSIHVRNSTYDTLLKFDEPRAAIFICKELNRLAERADSEPNIDAMEEEYLGILVTMTDAPEVWRMFDQTARRVRPNLQACWLRNVAEESKDTPARRARKIAFLHGFIDDPRVWHDEEFPADNDRKQPEYEQRPDLTHIIGNQAAESLGQILHVSGDDSRYRNEKQWKKYRTAVVAALKKEP